MPLWTEQQTTVAAMVVTVAAAALTVAGMGQASWAWLAALAVAAASGLLTSGFGGGLGGLFAGAAAVALLRFQGLWAPSQFTSFVLVWLLVIVAGSLTGMAANGARAGAAARARGRLGDPRGARPAAGSLGLIDAEAALVRLEEERLRSRTHLRDLSVIGLRVTSAREIPSQHQRALHRAVARLIETKLASSDVPFAWSDSEFGAILPEVDEHAAWAYMGPLFSALESATFTVREEDGNSQRHQISTFADLEAAVSTLDLDVDDARYLLRRARPEGLAATSP